MRKLLYAGMMTLMLVALIAGCSDPLAGDVDAPAVSLTDPADAAVDVALEANISATFSEVMDSETISSTTFTVTGPDTTVVAGAVSLSNDGFTATFNPTDNLLGTTIFTATITTGAKDVAGNGLAEDHVWSFTTRAAPDITAPVVSSVFPTAAATGVALEANVTATFSEAIDSATFIASSFVVTGLGAAVVPGVASLSVDGLTATFNPTDDLAGDTLFTATIATNVEDMAGNALAADYIWSFTTGATPDTTAPVVSSNFPAADAVDVALGANITATFSELMDVTTLTTTTFTVTGPSAAVVNGGVTYTGSTATFNPTADLAGLTVYTATITTGAEDLAGNGLATNYSWSFTTGVPPDTTAPTVISKTPVADATGVALGSNVTASFSEAMATATLTTATFTLKDPLDALVGGAVSLSGNGLTATFNPTADLLGLTVYTATITTGAEDLAGNGLTTAHSWSFTTGATPDTTAPTVISKTPAAAAIDVALVDSVTATFSEEMNADTLTTSTFTLADSEAAPVTGVVSVSLDGLTATFNPTGDLAGSTVYTATITTGAEDLAGNTLAVNHVWTFTTAAVPALGPAVVNLGSAENYVILASTLISTTGTTAITGDLGMSPAAQAAVTGFALVNHATNTYATSSLVTGKVYAADNAPPTPSTLTTAIGDMQTAYTDAAGRVNPDELDLGAGNISGLTLVPGLYKWGTALQANTGFTISGAPNDVWIFQVASNLTIGNGVIITLAGGAQAKNIFWQVAGQTTLGTTAQFKGIVLCMTQIIVQNGATVNGRLLAQTAVTLDANAVTQPE